MSKHQTPFVQIVADLNGKPRSVYILRCGVLVPIANNDFARSISPDRSANDNRSRESLVRELWIRVVATYLRWVRSGDLTLTQLRTIRLLLLDRLPLREVARRERVSAAAIHERVESVRDKAPEFHRWWTTKNAIRRHAALNRKHAR
jgi:hypothetical protein